MGKVEREQIAKILPDRNDLPSVSLPTRDERVAQGFAAVQARTKYLNKKREQEAEQEREARVALAEQVGLDMSVSSPEDMTQHQITRIAEQQKQDHELAALYSEAQPSIDVVPPAAPSSLNVPTLSHSRVSNTLTLQGAAKADVVKLLNSLNINLNVQLTKSDTANLLACLLTCNETQLKALLNNRKVPIVIKTVIKRLLNDSEKGDITTVEKLWDRVFGKNAMSVSMPDEAVNKGLIPDMPISREAYIVIRDTLMK